MRSAWRCLRSLGRWALRGLLGALVIVASTCLAIALLVSTAPGKRLVSSWIVGRVNEELSGSLAVRRLEKLTLSEIVLVGVSLTTRGGDEVARLEKVRLDVELWALLRGEWVLPALRIDGAVIDLRFPQDPAHGLLAALRDPAPGGQTSPPPSIRVEQLSLRGVDVRLPQSATPGPVELRGLELDASISLGAHSSLELRLLRGALWRAQAQLGEVTLSARVNDAGQPSRVELRSTLAGVEIALHGSATHRKGSDVGRAPIEVEGRLSGLTGERLAQILAQPELRRAFLGPLSARLRVSGSPADLGVSASLTSRAGAITVDSRSRRLKELDLTLGTERLRLAELFAGAPDWRLTTSSTLRARRSEARPGALLRLRSTVALNEAPLPPLTAHAELSGRQLSAIDLRVEDAKTSLRVGGTAELSGAARLTLDADVDAASLLPVASALGVSLPETHGRARAKLSWAREEGGRITGRGVLEGSGTLRKTPWRLTMLPAQLLDTGVRLPRVTLTFAGQALTLRGQYSTSASDLELQLVDVDLERLLEPFERVAELRGRLSALVVARGAAAQPILRARVQVDGISVAGGAPIDVRAQGELDAQRGAFQLEGHVRAPRASAEPRAEPALMLRAQGRFSPGVAWRRGWLDGEHQVNIELSRLGSDAVSAVLGRALPASFDLDGELSLSLAHRVPVVRWSLQGELGPPAAARGESRARSSAGAPRHVTHSGVYENGKVEARLGLADRDGPWLGIEGELAWPPGAWLTDWLARPSALARPWELLDHATGRLHLEAAPRSSARWPATFDFMGISGAVLSARLDVEKQPQQEPEGKLSLEARALQTSRGLAECSSRALVGRGWVELGRGRFRAGFSASGAERELLHVAASGEVELGPLTRGEPPRWTDVDLTASSRRLPLAELPFICERWRGLLDARAHLRASGPTPGGLLEVQVHGFSRGSDETVDLDVSIAGDPARLDLNGTVTAAGKRSSSSARLPLARRAGTVGLDPHGPLDVRVCLDQLPIGPFAGSDGAISYASGAVSGELSARGEPAAPKLRGELRLEDVAFTITAIAQPLSDIRGVLAFHDGTVLVKDLAARDAGGQLAIQGSFNLRGPRSIDGALDLVARDFPLRQGGQVVATTSTTARIRPSLRGDDVTVQLELTAFDTWLEGGSARKGLSLALHPDLVIDGSPNAHVEQASQAPEPARPRLAGSAPPRKLTLHLDADKGFWVRRADFSMKLDAALTMTLEAGAAGREAKLTVDGHVTLERGHVELLGRPFDVKRGGTLRFSGAPVPAVALTAIYVDRRSDAAVEVHVSGSAASPQVDFSIDGEEASAAEALQAIYGGPEREDEDTETEAEVQAEQMLAALTAGILTTSIRKKLGAMAPIVTVAPTDDEGAAAVRAGFELDTLIPDFLRHVVTGVYVEGSVSAEPTDADDAHAGDDMQRETLIELHFPHDLVGVGRHGPGATWSIDLGWRPGPF